MASFFSVFSFFPYFCLFVSLSFFQLMTDAFVQDVFLSRGSITSDRKHGTIQTQADPLSFLHYCPSAELRVGCCHFRFAKYSRLRTILKHCFDSTYYFAATVSVRSLVNILNHPKHTCIHTYIHTYMHTYMT